MKRVRAVRMLIGGAGAFCLAACDIPTDLPILEQNWVIEIEGSTIGVDDLLPPEVAVSGNAFDITVDPVATNRTLGDLCPACINSPFPVPVPAFADSFDVTQALPADVSAASVTGGAIALRLDNGFDFDPLADGGNGHGSITMRVFDQASAASLGSVTWDGAAGDVLPANGGSSTKTLAVSAASIGGTLVVRTSMDVPGGQQSTIDTSDQLSVTATPGSILLASATVLVTDKSVTFGPEALDTEDIESTITDNIVNGSIILEIDNPFAVALSGTLDIGAPGDMTSKSLAVGSGTTSTVTLSYSGVELQKILGVPGVTFAGSVLANATGPVVVTPTQELSIQPTIDLTVCVGGDVDPISGVCGG